MIEQQLRETFERAAATGPSEAGAYDRFLRHRRRRVLGAAIATSLVLVLAIGLAVVVPRVQADRRTTIVGPKPARPAAMFSRPEQGFELDLPAGWALPRVVGKGPSLINSKDDPQIMLELKSPHAAGLDITTGLIDPRFGVQLGVDGAAAAAPKGIDYLVPTGAFSKGQRPDGRRFLRTLKRQVGEQTADWYVAWPYQCALGPRPTCPAVLRLRVLHVSIMWSRLVTSARMLPAGERVVGAVRPIGNAVDRSPVPGRQPCGATGLDQVGTVTDYQGPVLRNPGTGATVLGRGTRVLALRTEDYNLLYCRIGDRIALQILDGDKLAAIRNNGFAIPVPATLPEGVASSPRQLWTMWEWTNWCGSRSATAWLVDPTAQPAKRLARFRTEPPPCLDPNSPPVLQYAYSAR
jgi:hypothetical protein